MPSLKRCKISVTYSILEDIDIDIDNKIKTAMESIGCVWYAQGINLTNGVRDIAFDYSPKGI
jgi:hypothetical protein